MRLRLILGLALLSILLPAATLGDDITKEKEFLIGTWVPYYKEIHTVELSSEQFKNMTVVITKDKVVFQMVNTCSFTYTLDPSKDPKWIDLTCLDGFSKGKVAQGIYSCEDGLMVLCFNSSCTDERPKTFITRTKSAASFSLYKLKRVDP